MSLASSETSNLKEDDKALSIILFMDYVRYFKMLLFNKLTTSVSKSASC